MDSRSREELTEAQKASRKKRSDSGEKRIEFVVHDGHRAALRDFVNVALAEVGGGHGSRARLYRAVKTYLETMEADQ